MIKDVIQNNQNTTANQKKLEELKKIFPSCFTSDGKFDIERFNEEIKDDITTTKEGYELKFLGKNYARLLASLDTQTVIKPDTEHNKKCENANSKNVYISGDNLDALKHLLKSYAGKIKCIYIDPPYNTGNDGFVYNDKFNFDENSLQTKLSIDAEHAKRIIDFTTKGSRSHSAWLTFMYPRLQLARDLLKDDGVIFISIDDNEQANLKLLCDDVFGAENFVAVIPWRKRTAKSDVPFGVSQDYEWILCYAKSEDFIATVDGKERKYYETPDFPNRPWRIHDMTKQTTAAERPNSFFTMINPKNGDEYLCDPNRTWRITKDTFQKYYDANEIVFPGDYDFLKISKPVARYFKDKDMAKDGENFGKVPMSTKLPDVVGMSQNGTKEMKEIFGSIPFSYPKPVNLIKYLIKSNININEQNIILDFFSGSATTAHALMELNTETQSNCRYILVQLPEITSTTSEAYKAGYKTIDQIGMARIQKAAAKIASENPMLKDTMDLGFKHYTLCDVAQNTLDKIEKFNPNILVADNSIYNDFGLETVLQTYLIHDGYTFNAEVQIVELESYKAYWCKNHLYLIEPNFSDKSLKSLFDKYNTQGNFNPQNIVVFGYNFNFTELENLKVNVKTLIDSSKNLKVAINVRY